MILRLLSSWFSKRTRSGADEATPDYVLDRYFAKLERLKAARGKDREAIAAALVAEAVSVRSAFLELYPDQPLPQFPAYERLAIELEKQGRLDDAARICRLAMQEGWQDVGFAHRLARCERNIKASAR